MKTLVVLAAFLFLNGLAMADSEYRHLVLLSFKKDASAEDITKIEKSFAGLQEKIDLIQDFEWGTDVSPEGLAKGYTHCFLVTFKDKAALEAYLPHDAHQAFVAGLKEVVEDVLVIDYVAR